MASDYERICEENRRRYGTDIGRIGPMLLADRYDDRTHFLFELLQNAEDALGRRIDSRGSRAVTFELSPTSLGLSHFGRPFDEADVRGVCGIAESTKDNYSIGRFGIGFKSVYTFTDRPAIHSGDEDFFVENYVQPQRADRTARKADETQIVLPLRVNDLTAREEITAGFRRLGPGVLLFLRHINEISWTVEDSASGFYLRNVSEILGPNVQRVTVIGQESGRSEVDQNWLVFHREVTTPERGNVGRVEVAFSLVAIKDAPGRWAVQTVASSPLVVFFPTVVSTHLGFLVQGPYRTTPSRDNIPRGERWNQDLVKETATLLVEAMRWMRDNSLLDTDALRSLPLDREKFPEESMFAPLFDAVRQAFQDEALLPAFNGGHVPASQAKLARTQELRELVSPTQVASLFGAEVIDWLSDDITQDKAPDIRQYLMRELGIEEVTPAKLVANMTKSFLEAQADDWVLRLYEFLSGQEAALRRRLDTIPLIRLEDGTHVIAREDGKPNAFLPGVIETGFPTMRRSTCESPEARGFLLSLGITEPDPVDDVIWNVLPKYQKHEVDIDGVDYAADIERIRVAFTTDSTAQRDMLCSALRETNFVMVVDMRDSEGYLAKPGDTYIATDRLKQLFAGVAEVFIVDDAYDCLRGEEIRDLLVTCGASRYLTPDPAPKTIGPAERAKIRKQNGLEHASWENQPEDFTIRGLTQLLELLPDLDPEEAKSRAKVLWDALSDLEARGTAPFYGSYKWGYSYQTKTARFDAAFIRMLTQVAWVPDAKGELVFPGIVMFDILGWKPNPFLQAKLAFKPPILDQLAKEAGIDPAAIDFLRKHGITSVAELSSRLGISDPPTEGEEPPNTAPAPEKPSQDGGNHGAAKNTPPDSAAPGGGEGAIVGAGEASPGTGGPREGGHHGGSGGQSSHRGMSSGAAGGQGRGSQGHAGGRKFISYIGAHPQDEESDPDGLGQAERMRIENEAIELIIAMEPTLFRTPEGNPGFDLYEVDGSGTQVRWVEVKSMTGGLIDRPVGLSRTQFDFARERGAAYWLYVVEHATDIMKARVLKIQDPVAQARTFTFDSGWCEVAQIEPPE